MRQITIIKAITQASMEIGITQRPVSTATASLDQDVMQMVALLSAVADELLIEEPYATTLGDGNWLKSATQGFTDTPTADNDLILFDGRLVINGLKYRFLKAKGLEFGEEMRDFSTQLNKLAANANSRVLDLDFDEGRVV